MLALLEGTLTADASGCVRVKTTGTAPVAPVWPRGYTVRGDSESFEILEGSKNVVARSGTPVAMGGGSAGDFQNPWTERECANGSQLWMVGTINER
jgi:hypothetical protein